MADLYLIQATDQAALTVSHAAYVTVTPNWAPETHHTAYLVGYVRPTNPLDLRVALQLPDTEKSAFTAQEQAAMLTKAQINAQGWNVNGEAALE